MARTTAKSTTCIKEEASIPTIQTAIAGKSLLRSVPQRADVYFLAHLLHDWDDDEARAIVGTCRRAMSASSRLLIAEVSADQLQPRITSASDGAANMTMMVAYGEAKDRTQAEFAELLEASRFKLSRVIPTRSEVTHCRPPAQN